MQNAGCAGHHSVLHLVPLVCDIPYTHPHTLHTVPYTSFTLCHGQPQAMFKIVSSSKSKVQQNKWGQRLPDVAHANAKYCQRAPIIDQAHHRHSKQRLLCAWYYRRAHTSVMLSLCAPTAPWHVLLRTAVALQAAYQMLWSCQLPYPQCRHCCCCCCCKH
jgi:hypothetical protein